VGGKVIVLVAGLSVALHLSTARIVKAQDGFPAINSQSARTPFIRRPPELSSLVDLNKASRDELNDLPRVGRSLAYAIINARPYSQKEDLIRRKIVPLRVYQRIKLLITVQPQ
jgi:DNA uptake protein ComE-like DNA-binding protein